jgi:hypothetical protein
VSYSLAVLTFAGPLLAPAIMTEQGTSSVSDGRRWSTVRLAELREKDTDRINFVTAGEEQMSSIDRCALAADAGLCRVLVSAVNVATIIGSSIK